jgi:hypothetical protein
MPLFSHWRDRPLLVVVPVVKIREVLRERLFVKLDGSKLGVRIVGSCVELLGGRHQLTKEGIGTINQCRVLRPEARLEAAARRVCEVR